MGVVRTKLGLSGQVRYTHFPFIAKLGLINHLVLFFNCILDKNQPMLNNLILSEVEKNGVRHYKMQFKPQKQCPEKKRCGQKKQW